MKKWKIQTLLLAAILVAWPALASEQSVLEDDLVAEARALLQAGRDEIIADELGLTEAESKSFWPLYEVYRADVLAVRDRYAQIIARYLKAYNEDEITDEFAENLLSDWLAYKEDLQKLQRRYVRKFRRVLPVRKVVRFYQLENKMDAEIDAELAVVVPLMEPV